MALGAVVYYDYRHCRGFLEQRALELKKSTKGLDSLALCRELIYSFSYEALETGALTLGQFDSSVVYLFVPSGAGTEEFPDSHRVARAKAMELLKVELGETPLAIELLAGQVGPPEAAERGRIDRWMRREFLDDVVLAHRIQIQLFFNGATFFRDVLVPQLEQRGFILAEDYLASAKRGDLKVRHPALAGKLFKLPWVLWVREMMGGGYSTVYLAVCLANCLQKLEQAVPNSARSRVEG